MKLAVPAVGHVHLHSIAFGSIAQNAEDCFDVLSADERARADKFVQAEARQHYLTSHVFVRKIIASYLGCLPAAVPLRAGPSGQPHIEFAGDLRYSLAHSSSHAVIALTVGTPIGVDIECPRSVPDALGIAQRFFSSDEVQTLHVARPEDRNTLFLRLWTCKEAFIKAIGLGLAYDLKRFTLADCDTDAPTFRKLEPPYGPPSGWSLSLLTIFGSCVVAVAAQVANAIIVTFDSDQTSGDECRAT